MQDNRTLIDLKKLPNTHPQLYRLTFRDKEVANKKLGYVQDTRDYTEDELRAILKKVGISEAQIELWLARV